MTIAKIPFLEVMRRMLHHITRGTKRFIAPEGTVTVLFN